MKEALLQKLEKIDQEKSILEEKIEERNAEYKDYDLEIENAKERLRELRCTKSEQERILAEKERENRLVKARIEEIKGNISQNKKGFQEGMRDHCRQLEEKEEIEQRKVKEMHEKYSHKIFIKYILKYISFLIILYNYKVEKLNVF